MKKILILLITVLLTSCTNTQRIDIIAPGGAVGITHAQIAANADLTSKYNIEIVDGTVQLAAEFAANNKEVILAPINLGIKFYNDNESYLLAAIVTWGNLYIASSSEISDLASLDGKTVYTFGLGSLPYIILSDLLSKLPIDVTLENLGDATTMTQQKLLVSPEAIVLIAEPALSVVKANFKANKPDVVLNVIDLQQAYSASYGMLYPQAGVFVKKSFANKNKTLINAYLDLLKEASDFANTNPEETSNYAKDYLAYPQPLGVLIESMPRNNINYKEASESKEALDVLIEILLAYNSELIGAKPNDGFYYER